MLCPKPRASFSLELVTCIKFGIALQEFWIRMWFVIWGLASNLELAYTNFESEWDLWFVSNLKLAYTNFELGCSLWFGDLYEIWNGHKIILNQNVVCDFIKFEIGIHIFWIRLCFSLVSNQLFLFAHFFFICFEHVLLMWQFVCYKIINHMQCLNHPEMTLCGSKDVKSHTPFVVQKMLKATHPLWFKRC